jgi:FkbM family methyltransferase
MPEAMLADASTNDRPAPSCGMELPATFISGGVTVRNPFRVVRLPPLCRRYVRLHYQTNRSGFKGVLKAFLRERTLDFERRYRGERRGMLSLAVNGGERRFSFNPLNTQFHSVYAPAHANGYEPETAALIDRLLPSDGVFFDAGANWGHFSLFAASRRDFRGDIHSFEPMPSTFRDLQESILETRLEGVIHAHNLALSDAGGESRMVIPDGRHSGLATISKDGSGVPMQRAPLDSLPLPKPDVIKIDVEGHEAAMLRGAAETIEKSRPMIIFESASHTASEPVFSPFAELEKHGYRFFLPAFAREENAMRHLVGYGDSGGVTGEATLVLVPFEPQTRLLMTAQFNVLACHGERLADLRQTLRGAA